MNPHIAKRQGRTGSIVRAAALEIAVAEPPTPVEVREDPPPPDPAAMDAANLRSVLVELSRHVERLRTQRGQAINDVSRLSIELGVALAERLLGAEIAADRQRLDRIVEQALARLRLPESATVYGHPDDIALVLKQMDTASMPGVRFAPDATLARGHVRVDANECFASWDTAACLRELRTTLLEQIDTQE